MSGQNVALVAGGALVLARLLGVPRLLGEVGALAGIAAYVLAVGAQPSVIRAGVVGALGSLAWLAARQRDRWHFLLLAAFVLLAWNPYTLLDAGFQLSFAAVAAIFVARPAAAAGPRGLSAAALAARGDRRLDGVRRGDGARAVAPVPRGAAARRPGERARRAGDGAAARRSRCSRRCSIPSRPAPPRCSPASPAGAPRGSRCARAWSAGCRSPRSARRAAALALAGCALLGAAYAWRRWRELKPVYLISGSDRPKIRLALERLRNHFEEGAVEVLGADEHPADDAVAACNALGLFGGERRLVIVEDVDALEGAGREGRSPRT